MFRHTRHPVMIRHQQQTAHFMQTVLQPHDLKPASTQPPSRFALFAMIEKNNGHKNCLIALI